jgi:hypothetical protein
MINEFDRVVLTSDMPEHGLAAGDVATVVMVHGDHEGYELEFCAPNGETVAVVSAFPNQIRRAAASEINHARPLAAA